VYYCGLTVYNKRICYVMLCYTNAKNGNSVEATFDFVAFNNVAST